MIHSKNYIIWKLNNFANNTENISCVMQTEPQLHVLKKGSDGIPEHDTNVILTSMTSN